MLHESETWPVRKENVVALLRAEMRMVRWTCGIKLKDRFPIKELKERLGQGIGDIALVIWYYSRTCCDSMGMCCKKMMIGGRNA